jgi:hypothetical protein
MKCLTMLSTLFAGSDRSGDADQALAALKGPLPRVLPRGIAIRFRERDDRWRMRLITSSSVGYGDRSAGRSAHAVHAICGAGGTATPVAAVMMARARRLVCVTCGSSTIVGTSEMIDGGLRHRRARIGAIRAPRRCRRERACRPPRTRQGCCADSRAKVDAEGVAGHPPKHRVGAGDVAGRASACRRIS